MSKRERREGRGKTRRRLSDRTRLKSQARASSRGEKASGYRPPSHAGTSFSSFALICLLCWNVFHPAVRRKKKRDDASLHSRHGTIFDSRAQESPAPSRAFSPRTPTFPRFPLALHLSTPTPIPSIMFAAGLAFALVAASSVAAQLQSASAFRPSVAVRPRRMFC
jgi:hypothetical protein